METESTGRDAAEEPRVLVTSQPPTETAKSTDVEFLHAEIVRLEEIIRKTAKHEDKTAIVIDLQTPYKDGKAPSVRIVVSGPAFKDGTLVKAGSAAMALYLRVWESIEIDHVKRAAREGRAQLKDSAPLTKAKG